MFQAGQLKLRDLSQLPLSVLFAAMLAVGILAGSAGASVAQEKLTPEQEQDMAKCLAPCKKGDAQCQDTCSDEHSSAAFSKASGSCVRACADALSVATQTQAEDLVHCVRACN